MNWRRALLSVVGVACALLFSLPGIAGAHATLVASTPADESRLASPPDVVTLTFDEAVRLGAGAAQVISSTGTRVDAEHAHLSGNGRTVIVPLRRDIPTGSYAAIWRVVSADTHVVTGSIAFGVRVEPDAPPPVAAAQPSSVTWSDRVVHGLIYIGLVANAGILVVTLALFPDVLSWTRFRRVVVVGWVAMLLGCLLTIGVRGMAARDVGLSGALSADVLYAGFDSDHAGWLIARLLLVVAFGVVTAMSLRRRLDRRAALMAAGSIAVAISVTIAADGHSGVGGDAWAAVPATTIHVGAMLVWLGGLMSLALVLARRRATGADVMDNPEVLSDNVLRRWSVLAFGSVVVLVLSGEYQAWRQIRPLQALWRTDYGITLMIKLALVVVMLASAVIARRRLSPHGIRRAVPVEVACGIAVVLVTSVLVTEPPARTSFGPAVTITAPLEGRSARISIDPTRHGPTVLTVSLTTSDGKPVSAEEVSGKLSSDSAGVAALGVRFGPVPHMSSRTVWRSRPTVIPAAGTWTFTLDVEFSSADAIVTAVDFRVW